MVASTERAARTSIAIDAARHVRTALEQPRSGTKLCRTCFAVKPLTDFGPHRSAFGGRHHDCRE
jgi:hypothetical protein